MSCSGTNVSTWMVRAQKMLAIDGFHWKRFPPSVYFLCSGAVRWVDRSGFAQSCINGVTLVFESQRCFCVLNCDFNASLILWRCYWHTTVCSMDHFLHGDRKQWATSQLSSQTGFAYNRDATKISMHVQVPRQWITLTVCIFPPLVCSLNRTMKLAHEQRPQLWKGGGDCLRFTPKQNKTSHYVLLYYVLQVCAQNGFEYYFHFFVLLMLTWYFSKLKSTWNLHCLLPFKNSFVTWTPFPLGLFFPGWKQAYHEIISKDFKRSW